MQSTSHGDKLVDLVYDVVLDPTRFDDLIFSWQNCLKGSLIYDELFDGLASHLERANQLLTRIDVQSSERDLERLLDSETQPILIFNEDAILVTANQAAVNYYNAQPGDCISTIQLTRDAAGELREIVTSCCQSGLPKGKGKIAQIHPTGSASPVLLSFSSLETASGLRVCVMKSTEILWPEKLNPLLKDVFQLTDAEIDIVRLIIGGYSPTGVSEMRHTSLKTVRTQLRIIFQKTSTQNQQELLRLIIGFSQLGLSQLDRTGDEKTVPSSLDAKMHLASGQSVLFNSRNSPPMEILFHGSQTGLPVIMFHDEITGDAFLEPLLSLDRSKAFRFHAPLRYGYGRSEMSPDHRLRTAKVCNVIKDYIVAQKFDVPVRLLACGNGAYFATRFANDFPEHCKSLVMVSPSLPLQRKEDLDGMQKYCRFISSCRLLSPKMLEFALRSGFKLFQRIGAKRFAQMIYDAPEDIDQLKKPRNVEILEFGSRLLRAQGYTALLADEKNIAEDWLHEAARLKCPVTLLLGENDAESRRKRAAIFAATNPNINLQMVEKSGALLSFSDPEAVLAALQITRPG